MKIRITLLLISLAVIIFLSPDFSECLFGVNCVVGSICNGYHIFPIIFFFCMLFIGALVGMYEN